MLLHRYSKWNKVKNCFFHPIFRACASSRFKTLDSESGTLLSHWIQTQSVWCLKYSNLLIFSPSHERSDLSSHHSVRRLGCLVGWLFGWMLNFFMDLPPPPPTTPKKSSDLKNSKTKMCFTSFWATFLLRTPPPPHPSKRKIFWHKIWLDVCSDGKKIWKKFFFWNFELKFSSNF